jgi:hypothetical protein
LRCALIALLDDLPADLPLLLLATAELAADAATAAEGGQHRQQQLRLPAAASGSCSGAQHQQEQQQQQQPSLESMGLEPSLAALFPALGSVDELSQSLQQQQQQQQQNHHHHQQQQPAAGCDVLGRVLLGQVGPAERKQMFKVSDLHASVASVDPKPQLEVVFQTAAFTAVIVTATASTVHKWSLGWHPMASQLYSLLSQPFAAPVQAFVCRFQPLASLCQCQLLTAQVLCLLLLSALLQDVLDAAAAPPPLAAAPSQQPPPPELPQAPEAAAAAEAAKAAAEAAAARAAYEQDQVGARLLRLSACCCRYFIWRLLLIMLRIL